MDAREAKIAQMKANQTRWMEERQRANDIAEVKEERAEGTRNRGGLGGGGSDEVLLNKLTERISTRLRVELKEDLRKSTSLTGKENIDLAASMENYLSGELMTHQCQICYELMCPPKHTPTLLFPCGHTFCKVRWLERSDSRSGSTAVYCLPTKLTAFRSLLATGLRNQVNRSRTWNGKVPLLQNGHHLVSCQPFPEGPDRTLRSAKRETGEGGGGKLGRSVPGGGS